MGKALTGWLMIVVVWWLPAVAIAGSALQFQAPPGWVAWAPGAPAEDFARLPQGIQAQGSTGRFAFLAASPERANPNFITNMNVTISRESAPITDRALREFSAELLMHFANEDPRKVQRQEVSRELISISGVTCGRIVHVLDFGSVATEQVQYLIPGASDLAVITFSTTPEEFEHYQPMFAAAAEATRGIAEPPGFWGRLLQRSAKSAVVCGLAGGLGGLVLMLLMRRQAKPAP
jgi:hypothetical protein